MGLVLRKESWYVVLLLSLFFLSFQVGNANAGEQPNVQIDRLTIINLPAYSVLGSPDDTTNVYNAVNEQEFLSMSDQEFKDNVRSNLASIIDQKEKDARIRWNEDIVKYVEILAPDHVDEIKEQIATDTSLQSTIVTASEPGSEDLTWVIYDYNLGGIKLYAFLQRIAWSWNSTQITSISKNAYSRIWAPLWRYEGINDQSGAYNNNKFSYTQYHEGHFVGEIAGYPLVNTYPWHQTTVMTGGGWAHNEGFN